MKKSYLYITMLSLVLTSCATPTVRTANNYLHKQHVTTTGNYPAKNPEKIALFQPNQSPLSPYKVIGVAKVATHNRLGMQRPTATMHNMMKNLAASIGGDGLINITPTDKGEWEAHVIQYQKILI